MLECVCRIVEMLLLVHRNCVTTSTCDNKTKCEVGLGSDIRLEVKVMQRLHHQYHIPERLHRPQRLATFHDTAVVVFHWLWLQLQSRSQQTVLNRHSQIMSLTTRARLSVSQDNFRSCFTCQSQMMTTTSKEMTPKSKSTQKPIPIGQFSMTSNLTNQSESKLLTNFKPFTA